jgi:hypothetical protein
MSRILRCAACHRRIKPTHPHVGLVDLAKPGGREISYHASSADPSCQRRGVEEIAAMLERGRVYVLRLHHSSLCPDEVPGWGCTGGCFDPPLAVAN